MASNEMEEHAPLARHYMYVVGTDVLHNHQNNLRSPKLSVALVVCLDRHGYDVALPGTGKEPGHRGLLRR